MTATDRQIDDYGSAPSPAQRHYNWLLIAGIAACAVVWSMVTLAIG
jgi:hypothetical protein